MCQKQASYNQNFTEIQAISVKFYIDLGFYSVVTTAQM